MGMTVEQFTAIIDKAIADASGKSADGIAGAVSKALANQLGALFPLPGGGGDAFKTPGQQFAEHPAIRAWTEAKASGISAPIEVKLARYGLKPGEFSPTPYASNYNQAALAQLGLSAPGVGKDLTSDMFPSPRTYLPFVPFPMRRIRVRDLMNVAGIATPQLEYARVTGYSNNAAGVGEGSSKPQSTITTTTELESARVVATFMPVTRQALEDVPQLRAWLDAVLDYFIALTEDRMLLNGGGGLEFTGILNTPNVLTQPLNSNTRIDAARKGVTQLETAFGDAGFQPTGFVFHPDDWETISLEKDENLRHLLIGTNNTVADGIPNRLWGLPVAVTPAMPAGTGLLGAFDIACALWTYQGVTLRVSDSHSDFFIRNQLAVLAEARELFTVYFPKAFCKLTGF